MSRVAIGGRQVAPPVGVWDVLWMMARARAWRRLPGWSAGEIVTGVRQRSDGMRASGGEIISRTDVPDHRTGHVTIRIERGHSGHEALEGTREPLRVLHVGLWPVRPRLVREK